METWVFSLPASLELSSLDGMKLKVDKQTRKKRKIEVYDLACDVVASPASFDVRVFGTTGMRRPDRCFEIRCEAHDVVPTESLDISEFVNAKDSTPIPLPPFPPFDDLFFRKDHAGLPPVENIKVRFRPNGASRPTTKTTAKTTTEKTTTAETPTTKKKKKKKKSKL
ncbi:hypothetical protein CTAYLR_003844 [Chrysophaeum taylorii]|uniref:Uncharacterized protein n=1 Tax=Chrysophaeum taylorii TaxID=2483200 RepID=A0AAD7XP90_9STRA|nr:hypothetical protein CTAYLR_003844 [Chrysophaeum taylorii]